MLALSEEEISNTGCRQDNKAEATQVELYETCMMVSSVCVAKENNGRVNFVCAHVFHHRVWLLGDWPVCVCVCITSPQREEGVRQERTKVTP